MAGKALNQPKQVRLQGDPDDWSGDAWPKEVLGQEELVLLGPEEEDEVL